MTNPIVHLEIVGRNGEMLESFYLKLFGWNIERRMVGPGFPYGQINAIDKAGQVTGGIRHEPEGKAEITMSTKPTPICGQHNLPKEWWPTSFEYNDEGVSVRVPNVYAWVCPVDGEASYAPKTTDELIFTVRELIHTAKRAKARRSAFTEYMVAVQ